VISRDTESVVRACLTSSATDARPTATSVGVPLSSQTTSWVNSVSTRRYESAQVQSELILAQPRRLTSAHDDPQEADVHF